MLDNGRTDDEIAMSDVHVFHQPTLRLLLNAEALTEAQIVFGDDLIDRPIIQVVAVLTPPMRPGSLVVSRPEALSSINISSLENIAGLIVIKQTGVETAALPTSAPSSSSALPNAAAAPSVAPLTSVAFDVAMKRIASLCKEATVPLLVVPSFGDPAVVTDDIRTAFLRELKTSNARLHSELLALVLEEGLDGLVEEISNRLNRPVVVETADFKVLASRNMGATPVSQQRALGEEAYNALKRRHSGQDKSQRSMAHLAPIKVGRRLVLPILLADNLAGYVALMIRPSDDMDFFSDYLQAVSLAAMVDFSQRSRDGSVFAVTQKSLLRDLLSGNGLSASDQERLERHFGFDLSDALLVFAVEATAAGAGLTRHLPDEGFASTDIEGTRVYVLPYVEKNATTWQEQAQMLIAKIKEASSSETIRIQLGAARKAETILDLPEAYREARQALIIGSMVHGENEFVIGYGELGIKRLLYLVIDHPELERFYEETLAPLEAYDAEWESELVPSLRVYLEQGANLNSTARGLFIHRHTLRYRLEQIADILKVDIDSQEVLLNLQIAFLIRDMQSSRGKGKS